MRRVTTFQLLFILITCIYSCEKNLVEKPLDFLEESNSFNTERDAVLAINAVYSYLRDPGYYGLNMINLADVNSEQAYVRSDAPGDVIDVDKNQYTASNSLFESYYSIIYKMIDRANRVILNVPKIPMSDSVKKQIIGEAKFLRALGYFDLVRAFGDIPLITIPNNSVNDVLVARTPVDQVYAQIISDLSDAEQVLPSRYTKSSEIGRATRWAAKALLGKVYLTRKDWSNAVIKLKDVIDNSGHTLVADYRDVFDPDKKNGPEHIFSVQFSCIQLGYGSLFAQRFAIFLSYPINQGGGNYQATDYFYNSFPDGDYRKTVSMITYKVRPNGDTIFSRTGPHVDKYWDPSPCGSEQARNNFIVLRFADVLLMYAEALNELYGPTPEAYAAINRVRERARNGNPTAIPQNLSSGLTQDQFRDSVFQERSLELAFEGHRRWDLIRTGRYIATLTAAGINAQQKNLLYPIPQHQIDLNPLLTQNPGY